jgi:hypothetical protein
VLTVLSCEATVGFSLGGLLGSSVFRAQSVGVTVGLNPVKYLADWWESTADPWLGVCWDLVYRLDRDEVLCAT